MKASELIKELQIAIEKYGDLPVCITKDEDQDTGELNEHSLSKHTYQDGKEYINVASL